MSICGYIVMYVVLRIPEITKINYIKWIHLLGYDQFGKKRI
jgi:hypothetical protein